MKEFLDYIIDSFFGMLGAMLYDIWDILRDLFFLIVEEILSVGGWVMEFINSRFPELDLAPFWSMATPTLIHFLDYLDFGICIGIVVSALSIRFIMNFIPFIK